MSILRERGRFWWNSEVVPDGHYAPDDSVPGLLEINEDGRSTLELDGYLPTDGGILGALFSSNERIVENRMIQGTLKESNQRVLLSRLLRNGGRASNDGMSYEQYIADECLIGSSKFPPNSSPHFNLIAIDLKGLETWSGIGNIKSRFEDESIKVEHSRPNDLKFSTSIGDISIKYYISRPFDSESHSTLTLAESASIEFKPKEAASFSDIRRWALLIQDFFILLTNSDYQLDWPKVRLIENERKCHFWFGKFINKAEAPKRGQCWLHLNDTKKDFGQLFHNWKEKREIYGPGFALYFGTRRGFSLYREHRFVNLIWGLEAYDRRKFGDRKSKTERKVSQILNEITNENDKKWLEKRLVREPPLSERIYGLFENSPLKVEKSSLRKFAEECARCRNDISHYGGQRNKSVSYNDFLASLDLKSEALSMLYHAAILQEIGIDTAQLSARLLHGPYDYWRRKVLEENGLQIIS